MIIIIFVVVFVAVDNTKCCYHNVIASNLQSYLGVCSSQSALLSIDVLC